MLLALALYDGTASQAAEKPSSTVILSAAKNLALCIFKAMRDSSPPAAPQNDIGYGFFRSLFSRCRERIYPCRRRTAMGQDL
jgi:hypothetical protein